MSTITRPIMLDATGQEMVKCMNRQNAYLAMIAEGKRKEIYNSMSQIASIVRANTVEQNAILFPIGDQIIKPWKDMDDPVHNTDETAYQVPWDIVHHGLVTLKTGEIVPGMFLQMHKCSAYGVQASNFQAFKNCPDGLAASTYHVTFGHTWGSHGANAGTSWQFTLTQPVPAGGRLSGFERLADVETSAYKVKSWAKPTDAAPIEIVDVTAGSGGTFLGTMQFSKRSDDGLNSMQTTGYGHDQWSPSAIRQYLNAKGLNWFESKEDFDIRPDQYNKHGFMSGFDDDFLSAIKPVKVTTALNIVEGFDTATEDTYDTFFLPSLEQINVTPLLANVEGPYSEYWRRALGASGFVGTGSANIFDAFKVPAINAASAQRARLRSTSRGHACYSWLVDSSGCVISYSAINELRFFPWCVIC